MALRELKRRLELTLLEGSTYDLISDWNTTLGYTTASKKIRHPKYISAGPVTREGDYLNCITMGLSNDTDFQGSGQFKNFYALSIYSIDERIETEEQYLRHWDRIGLVRTALMPFLGGCVDPDNRVAWRALEPQQAGFEVEEWEQFGGIYLFYRLIADPSMNSWS